MESTATGGRIRDLHKSVHIRLDPTPGPVKKILFTNAAGGGDPVTFADRNWAARWLAFRVLTDFTATNWNTTQLNNTLADILIDLNTLVGTETKQALEIKNLLAAARDERASALGEILGQDGEFISTFMAALAMTPASHPQTFRVLHIASLVASFGALYYKQVFQRPRPSWECPALMPPIPVPGHSAYPSGHATQALLMAACMEHVLTIVTPALPQADRTALTETIKALARRVARNREIAGLHYPSDSAAGAALASAAFAKLSKHTGTGQSVSHYALRSFGEAVTKAAAEWKAG
jgi:membrane-associated phospholipid phosphatase